MFRYARKLILPLFLMQMMIPTANAQVNHARVCKAAIAAIFNQSIDNITVQSQTAEITHVSYARQSDGSVWKNKCKLSGDRVIWGGENGRWRDHALDEVITYKTTNSKITILQTFSDGSVISDS